VGEELMKLFEKEVAGQMDGGDPFDMGLKLFANNLQACILLFLGGASFGILTIFIMSLNGIVIGAIMEMVRKDHSALFVAAAILPHGIFEIPAFILSGALGILLAQSLTAEWYGTGDTAVNARGYARRFITYVLPLVAIAACVEAFITPVVIHLVA
jgi:stage II sporulation protein M